MTTTAPAQAAGIVTTVIAGNGTDGPLEDNVPATGTHLWGPADVAVLPDGTIAIADTNHHEVRSLPGDGTIQRLLGTGIGGCDPDGGTVLSRPRGLAADAQGNLFISTGCNLVERLAPDGTVTVVAGHNDPNATYDPKITPGMSARAAFLNQPAGIDYDDVSGTLTIVDQGSQRVLAVTGGQISVVAGNGINGFSGDGGAATDARLNYPLDAVRHAGKTYICDSSNRRVRVVAGGTINTLIGTDTGADLGDGGPAQNASLAGCGSLAFDAAGDLFIASYPSGAIREVDGFGNVSTPVTLSSGLAGITFDRDGNLIVAQDGAVQQVVRVSGLKPPAEIARPTLVSLSVATPQVSDPDLTRGVYFLPLDNGAKSDHFEYGWTADPAATKPDTALQSSRDLTGRLDFRATSPGTDWYLIGRAVGPDGIAGPWSSPQKIHTPTAPVMPVLGDSIASGHNIPDAQSATKCQDSSYGYPAEYFKRWQASLPQQWRSADSYQNFAFSGFAVVPHGRKNESGSVMQGGLTPCKESVKDAPLLTVEDVLRIHPGSWNHLVATMGIDDTNWNSVVFGVTVATKLPNPLSTAACSVLVKNTWTGYNKSLQASVTAGVKQVASGLRAADPGLKLDFQGYYNIAGTGPIPVACKPAMTGAMDTIQGIIRAGLPLDARFNDISAAMNSRTDRMQPFISGKLTTEIVQLTGWPHPNRDGAIAIAAAMPL